MNRKTLSLGILGPEAAPSEVSGKVLMGFGSGPKDPGPANTAVI